MFNKEDVISESKKGDLWLQTQEPIRTYFNTLFVPQRPIERVDVLGYIWDEVENDAPHTLYRLLEENLVPRSYKSKIQRMSPWRSNLVRSLSQGDLSVLEMYSSLIEEYNLPILSNK